MALQNIQNLLENSLTEVEALLDSLMEEIDEAETRKWMKYFMQAKGHRLRPILVLLSYKSFQPTGEDPDALIEMAAAVELLHTASLVHDDVIDEEQIRRSQDSLNSLKGNKVAILIGNVFYLKAFELVSRLPHKEYFLNMVKTSMDMCFGEIIQSEKLQGLLNEATYLDIIERKTAKLMALCCQSGALLAGAKEEEVLQMTQIGLGLGYLYQMKDDQKDWDVRLERQVDLDALLSQFHATFNEQYERLTGERTYLEGLKYIEGLIALS